MIALIGSSNWDVIVAGGFPAAGRVEVGEVRYEGPAGSTLNAASNLLSRRPLLITQVPEKLDPRHVELLAGVEVAGVTVDGLSLAVVAIGDDGERTIFLARRPTPWPDPPRALATAAVVDWHWTAPAEIMASYAPHLRGRVVAGARSAAALRRHGVVPFAIVDSLSDADAPDERWLRQCGCRWCVMTDGARGGRYWSEGKWRDYPAVPARLVDSSGCGDAFRAGLLAAIDDGKDVEEALEEASILGARAAERPGANSFMA